MADGTRVKLLDKMSGLLVRQTRYARLPSARSRCTSPIPITAIVPGANIKLPFTWQMTWVDGQHTINLMSVQPNAPIDAAKFAKPAPPK